MSDGRAGRRATRLATGLVAIGGVNRFETVALVAPRPAAEQAREPAA